MSHERGPGGRVLVGDRPHIREGPGEAVELGHHQGVAGSAGGECFAQSGSLAVGAGQAVVDVDPVSLDAKAGQAVTLGGEVLLIGGASGVPDKQRAHGAPPELGSCRRRDVAGSSIGQRPTPPSRPSPPAAARAAPRLQRDPHIVAGFDFDVIRGGADASPIADLSPPGATARSRGAAWSPRGNSLAGQRGWSHVVSGLPRLRCFEREQERRHRVAHRVRQFCVEPGDCPRVAGLVTDQGERDPVGAVFAIAHTITPPGLPVPAWTLRGLLLGRRSAAHVGSTGEACPAAAAAIIARATMTKRVQAGRLFCMCQGRTFSPWVRAW